MKLFITLALVTLVNLAWQSRPLEPVGLDPIDLAEGSTIAPEMLAAVNASCVLLVFFDPSCAFCGKVADAHTRMGGTEVETRWISDQPLSAPSFSRRLPTDTEILISRDLFDALGVHAVPAGAWIRDGRLIASGALSGEESDEELAAPCTAEPDATLLASR